MVTGAALYATEREAQQQREEIIAQIKGGKNI
jgi:hypothetical protein